MSISILLADDSITIQKVIGIIFGGEDYSVTVVDNGKSAVEKAIEVKPDVLLIDALMPGMSGYEACERIREIPELKQKPIVLLTGSFEPFDEEKAKSCGADTFLSKPFESQQIVSKVAEMYELGQSRISAAEMLEPLAAVTPPPLPVEAELQEPAPAVADDIWGAFTPETPAPTEPAAFEPVPDFETTSELPAEAFETIQEEPSAGFAAPVFNEPAADEQIGSQWVPVEEHTFEFEDETLAELPEEQPAMEQQEEPEFGEVTFADVATETKLEPIEFEPPVTEPVTAFTEKAMPEILESIPSFEEAGKPEIVRSAALSVVHPGPPAEETAAVFEPVLKSAAPVAAAVEQSAPVEAVPVTLTEEQLKAALASVSREIIEKIVWEVVPDLAEEMIKEAIRKIKEGQ